MEVPQMKTKTGPIHREQGREKKEAEYSRSAGLLSKETCVLGCLGHLQGVQTFTSTLRNFRSLYSSLSRVQSHIQFRMVSTTHHVQGVSLKWLLEWGQWQNAQSKDRCRGKKPLMPRASLWASWWSHPLNDLPQHPTISAASQPTLPEPASWKEEERKDKNLLLPAESIPDKQPS